jgi:hypothetical protein
MAGGECEGGLNHFTRCFAVGGLKAALFYGENRILLTTKGTKVHQGNPCDESAEKNAGVLRLREYFALRKTHCAQDYREE